MSVKVFISYAHKDEAHKDSLIEHLATLRRNKIISEWHDRDIVAGQNWKDQISENLEQAELILFLVSSTFLASEYCFDVEFGRALAKHEEGSAQLIPIIIRSCDWKTTNLGPFQGLPTDAQPVTTWPDQDAAWLNVVDGIKRSLTTFKPKQAATIPSASSDEKKNS
jgi:hypothetical protein